MRDKTDVHLMSLTPSLPPALSVVPSDPICTMAKWKQNDLPVTLPIWALDPRRMQHTELKTESANPLEQL